MLKGRRILVPICAAVAAFALASCGGDDGPDPSISRDQSDTLLATLQEIQANLDTDPPSCLVAADRVEQLQEEIDALPSSVDQDVKDSLQRGALNLGELVADPDQCERRDTTTTTEETTTEEPTTTEQPTTTEETTTQETTTTEPTTTTPPTTTQPPGTGGGISPGGGGGL